MAQLKDTVILGDLSVTGTIYGNADASLITTGTLSAARVPAINNLTGFSTYVYSATNSRTANTVLAAPNGSAGVASFRKLVEADLPTISASKISGTVSSATSATNATNTTNVNIAADTSSTIYVLGATTTGNTRIYRESSVYMSSNVLYGAAWNDYAEYRELKEDQEIPYGHIVIENGDDTLSLSTERLQPGGQIVSDTFGFAIGQTEKCKLPIAVSGRALVYTYEDRYEFSAGDAVCTGPNGTVSKMTREEIKEYPERIIGTVSAIPEYENWGEGNVKVDGRIWIYIK